MALGHWTHIASDLAFIANNSRRARKHGFDLDDRPRLPGVLVRPRIRELPQHFQPVAGHLKTR